MNVKLYSFMRLGMIHFIRLLPVEEYRLVLQAHSFKYERENLPLVNSWATGRHPASRIPLPLPAAIVISISYTRKKLVLQFCRSSKGKRELVVVVGGALQFNGLPATGIGTEKQ